MKKLVIFDCDGTLVDSEILASKVFPAVWSSMGVEMTADYFLCNFVGTGTDAEIVKKTMARLPPNAMDLADQKFEYELALNLEAVDGIREIIGNLRYPSCVASNSSLKHVRDALTKVGLSEFFDNKIFSSRDLDRPKPAPDVFLHAAKTMGFKPSECVVIEDSSSGIKAAQNAKMTVIGFMGGLHFNEVVKERLLSAKADFYCSSALELNALLLKLCD